MNVIVAPNKLWSKSFKEIYMDWMYETYLCNQQFKNTVRRHLKRSTRVDRKFHEVNDSLYRYCRQSSDEIKLLSVTGFHQHPTSSPEM